VIPVIKAHFTDYFFLPLGTPFKRAALFTPIAPLPSSNFLMIPRLVILLSIVTVIPMNTHRAGFKKLGEAKRRQLVAELNGMGEGVIAKAVESIPLDSLWLVVQDGLPIFGWQKLRER
jgi:hypothetical protein